MAFYGDFGKKPTRDQKRKSAEMRGGFQDEGSRYSGATRGKSAAPGRSAGYGKSTANSGSATRSEYGERSGYSPRDGRPGRPAKGPNPERTEFGERPAYGKSRGTAGGRDSRNAGPSRGFGEKGRYGVKSGPKSNEPRFAREPGQRYSERGAGTAPRPYGEQQEARRQYSPRPQSGRGEANRAEAYRYGTPVAPSAPAAYGAPVPGEGMDSVPAENLLSGRNPIREALKSGRDIEKILVARGDLSGSARELVQMAKEKHIPVQEVDRARLDAITHNHQGMLAFASAHEYRTVQDMLDLAAERGEAPFLVILDGITDPHNLGAIIRTAECAGAHGVIVQERRAVGLTPAAVKASAGAVEYMPVARVTNLTTTLLELKAQNIWAYAADMGGEDYATVDFSGPLALIIGAEGEGVSRRVLDTCDRRISLPIRGKIDSLNASVAAGVLLYAAARAR